MKPVTEEAFLARLRKICLPLEGTQEKLSHGHPSFATAKGIYAVVEEYHGDLSLCIKVGKEMQGVFLADPRFYKTPYIGHRGWVSLKLHAASLDWQEIAGLVKASHRSI